MEKKTNEEAATSPVITDRKQETKQVIKATLAVWSGAASYVLMMLVTMPISIHLIVNMAEGCDPEKDAACFAPTEYSQSKLTAVLSALRVCTFVMGCFLGALSDRIGRKALMFMALMGYALTGILYMVGWSTKSLALFLIGGMILGSFSPITPTGVSYVSDISSPDRLAGNLGILQGIGYFVGLLCGALFSLAIGAATTSKTPTVETPLTVLYDNMFYASYGIGFALAFVFAIFVWLAVPESLPKTMRKTLSNQEFFKRANPFQTVLLFTRSKYMFCLWLSAFLGYVSIGASEAVTGGWWMRRYLVTDLASFITFLVFLWLVSGIGSIVMTKIYVRFLGVKKACHVSMILTIVLGVAVSVARSVTESYIAAAVSFFASAAIPTLTALLVQQVDVTERGALGGALRSSEALGKFIGIVVFGAMFATYIAPFTPDASCVPPTYGLADKSNTCLCGVNTCPIVFSNSSTVYLPKPCSLGELTPTFYGSYSRYVPFVPPTEETRPVVPQVFIEQKLVKRDETCIGAGGSNAGVGFVSKLNRAWCAAPSVPSVGPMLNAIYGCQKYDIGNAAILKCLSDPSLYPYGMACYKQTETTILSKYAAASNESAALSPTGQNTQDCLARATSCNMTIFRSFVTKYAATVNVSRTLLITSRVLNTSFVGDGHCAEDGTVEFNLCWRGPIASFPGLIPFIYLAVMGIASYLLFVIAEVFFSHSEKKVLKENSVAVSPDSKAAADAGSNAVTSISKNPAS